MPGTFIKSAVRKTREVLPCLYAFVKALLTAGWIPSIGFG
jgi:hypothetical protein